MKTLSVLPLISGILLTLPTLAQEPLLITGIGDTVYVGRPNPLNVLVPGTSPDKLTLQCENGTVQGIGGQYTYFPMRPGYGRITVLTTNDGTTATVGAKEFYCTYAKPELNYFPSNQTNITRQDASVFRKPLNEKEGIVDRFSLYIVRNELVVFKQSFFGQYSGEVATINEVAAKQLSEVQNGDRLEITDVNVNYGQEGGRMLAHPGIFIVTDPEPAVTEHQFVTAINTDGKKLLEVMGRCERKMSITSTKGSATTTYHAFMPANGLIAKDGRNVVLVDKNSVKEQTTMQTDSAKITTVCKLTISGTGKKQAETWIAPCVDCFDEKGRLIGRAPLFWVAGSDAKKQIGKIDKQLASSLSQ